jgi:predicted transcriptional regulator
LQVADEKAKKTHIMHRANLSYPVLMRYLIEVTEASLVCFNTSEQCYTLTQKGQEYLDSYEEYARTSEKVKQCIEDAENQKNILERLCSKK